MNHSAVQPEGPGIVIAVDGPSGAGKSSAARGTARALGLHFLDTGAMYRAVTCALLDSGVDVTDPEAVLKHGLGMRVEINTDPDEQHVLVDGSDVTTAIRERRVTNSVSQVASIAGIRTWLIGLQRQIIAEAAAHGGIVAEGRDVGTVVAPDADLKVYLTASEQARALRRAAELAANKVTVGAEVTLAEQAVRDRLDAPQSGAAADAVEVDATDLDLAKVIDRIVGLAAAKLASAG